jgi:hypothetical protein
MQSAHIIEDALQIFAALFINVEDSSTHSGTVYEQTQSMLSDLTSNQSINDDAISKALLSLDAIEQNKKFLQSPLYIAKRDDTLYSDMYNVLISSTSSNKQLVPDFEKLTKPMLDRMCVVLRDIELKQNLTGETLDKVRKTLKVIHSTAPGSKDGIHTLGDVWGCMVKIWTISTHTCTFIKPNPGEQTTMPIRKPIVDSIVRGMISNMFKEEDAVNCKASGLDFFYDLSVSSINVSFAFHRFDESKAFVIPFVVVNDENSLGVKPHDVSTKIWNDQKKKDQSQKMVSDVTGYWNIID